MHAVLSYWKSLSLKVQLWGICLLLIAAGLVGVGISHSSTTEVRGAFDTVAETTAPAALLLVNTDRDAYQAQLALSQLSTLVGQPGEARDLQLGAFDENAEQTLTRFESYIEVAAGDEVEPALWDAYLADRQVWLTAAQAVIDAADTTTATAAYAAADAEFEAMRTHLDVIQETVYEPAIAGLIEVQAAAEQTAMVRLAGAIVVLTALGLLAAWRFSRSVSRRVADDSRSVRESTESLAVVSADLTRSAEGTSALATGTAGRADELTGHMQSLAAAVEEMGVSIAEIGRSTTEVSGISTQSVALVGQALERVSILGQSSAQISEVADVVTAIAEQTNLLALNATIEAARAGEAGKGFAVVASEVKDLANETAKATGQIRELIARIQGASTQVEEAIGGIHTTIEQVNDLQTSVASAVEEQSITTAEIGRTVSYVSDQATAITTDIRSVSASALEASRNADTTRAASARLRGVATSLTNLVDGRRDAGDTGAPASPHRPSTHAAQASYAEQARARVTHDADDTAPALAEVGVGEGW